MIAVTIPDVKNDADMRTCASAGNGYGVIQATVDGVKMKNLETCRASRYFNSSIVANNIYDSPAGRYRAFADGFFVFLEPLSAGNHDVHLKVSVLNPIKTNYNYNADWTYHLNVVP